MTITADTLLMQIDPDALPKGQEKAVFLPADAARSTAGKNVISFNQQRLIAQYLKGAMAPTMTWAEAVSKLRVEAGLTPNQYDFGMAEHVSRIWDAQTANDSLTVNQLALATDLVGVLSGQRDHRDADITKAVKARGPKIADTLLVRFVSASTKGEFNGALHMFNAVYGFPKPYTVESLTNAGNISGDGDSTEAGSPNIKVNEDGSVNPDTGSEEPF